MNLRLAGPWVAKSMTRRTAQSGSRRILAMWTSIATAASSHPYDSEAPFRTAPKHNRIKAIAMASHAITLSGHAKRIRALRWGAATLACLLLAREAPAQMPPVAQNPTVQNGYGTLSVTNSSVAVSTVTTSPNSAVWKMPLNGYLFIRNSPSSAGILYVCPLGGTCSSSNGIPLNIGDNGQFNLGGSTTSPTVIAASTATAIIGW